MIYCQECGAANDLGNPTCRLCGRALHHQRSTHKCTQCQELVGISASFCATCGATTSDVAIGAVAEGGPPPDASTIAALFSAPAPVDQVQGGPTGGDAFNLGAGLELPDWLKRAAAEAPPASVTSLPPVRHVPHDTAPHEASGTVVAASHLSTASAPAMVAEPPLPPIPDGGLAAAMPAWLTAGTKAVATPPPTSVADLAPRPSLIPSRSLIDDPTDTTSFITENDLPEWLRQLAANESAQAEEAERAAREAATAESIAAAAPALLPIGEFQLVPQPLLAATQPGEDFAASGRWLSRSGDLSSVESGRRSAFTNLVEEHEAEQDAIADAIAPIATRPVADPLARSTSAPPPAPAWSLAPGRTPSSSNAKRLIVIGALVLVIAVLLAYLVSSGGLG